VSDNKAGHNKDRKDHRQPCIECGELAHLIEVRSPVRKPSGTLGERRRKLYIHVRCL
jgi:hypothetical protein